jgi:hypothetical protein
LTVRGELLLPGVFIVLALSFDLFQYIARYVVFLLSNEKKC